MGGRLFFNERPYPKIKGKTAAPIPAKAIKTPPNFMLATYRSDGSSAE